MRCRFAPIALLVALVCSETKLLAEDAEVLYPEAIDLTVPLLSGDKSVRYDYPIVYVRVPRKGDDVGTNWPEIAHPV